MKSLFEILKLRTDEDRAQFAALVIAVGIGMFATSSLIRSVASYHQARAFSRDVAARLRVVRK